MTQHPPDEPAGHRPRYHGGDENADARQPLTAGQRRTRVLVIALVIAVLLALVILHITGTLGPGTNG